MRKKWADGVYEDRKNGWAKDTGERRKSASDRLSQWYSGCSPEEYEKRNGPLLELNSSPEGRARTAEQARRQIADPNSNFGLANMYWPHEIYRLAHSERMSKLATAMNLDDDSDFGKFGSGDQGLTGFHLSSKTPGGSIFYGSSWEDRACELLDVDNDVVKYERCFGIRYEEGRTYPDFLVTYKSNRQRILEVKGPQRFQNDKGKMRVACQYSKENGLLPYKVWLQKKLWTDLADYKLWIRNWLRARQESPKLTREVTNEGPGNSADHQDQEIVPSPQRCGAEPNKLGLSVANLDEDT